MVIQTNERRRGRLRTIARLSADRRGAALPIMAAGLMLMIGSVGSAIDIARIYITTSQMQAGVDAAALAGANAFDNKDDSDPNGRRKQVIAYFRDNFPDTYMGVQRAPDATPIETSNALLEPQFSTVNGISTTVVNARATLPMTFTSLFGFGAQTISVTAHAEFQPHPLEVMVVLDNTGSMQDAIDGVAKIDALKTAMHSFINVLYHGSNDPQPNLAMGIINYTNQVNVGAILKSAGVEVQQIPGYTDVDWGPSGGMVWKGCVANDDTTTAAISTSNLTPEAGAYDLTNVLPGEMTGNAATPMRAVRPLIMPPLWSPRDTTRTGTTLVTPTMNSTSGYYANGGGDNNLYGGAYTGNVDYNSSATTMTAAYNANNTEAFRTFANKEMFRRFFYRYYIGMNNGASNMADDVIVSTDGSYYDPTTSDAFNPLAYPETGRPFVVRTEKIPNLAFYKPVKPYVVTSNNTPIPSPNWQCPEPGLPIKYNVARSTFDNFITNNVWAIKPANGTMHHTGFIWGWRLLSRYDKFVRSAPEGAGKPVRAMVFMTDGKTDLSGGTVDKSTGTGQTYTTQDKIYTAYGSVNDKTITTSSDSVDAIKTAANNRFAKACAIANSYVFPDSKKTVQMYVVGINKGTDLDTASQTRLRNCGKDGYYLTTTPSDLNTAFAQIARTLVDVHLTQ